MTATQAVKAPAAPRHRRSEWRDLVLTPVGDGSSRRRVSDGVALVVAVGVLIGAVWAISSGPTVDVNLAKDLTSVPEGLAWLLSTLWYFGSYGVIAILALIALLSRRIALARDTAVAGFGAWVVGLLLTGWLGSTAGRPLPETPLPTSAHFPLVQLAAAAAVALAVLPYLTRPARRLFLTVVVVAALAATMRGDGFPLVVVASLVLGWAVASVVHLAFGSPTGMPDSSRVEDALGDLGYDVTDLAPVSHQVLGVAKFTGLLGGEAVAVSVYDRDAADAQFLAKAWRFLWYRDSGPRFSWSRVSQVEHEAFVTMSAAQAGAPTATVVGAGIAPDGKAAALITTPAPGRPLAELDPAEVTPAVLNAVFLGLGQLRAARISHGNLSGDVIVVADGARVAFEDFRVASVSADADRLGKDMADAMACCALVGGVQETVDAIGRTLGADVLSETLPHLQSGALSRANRTRLLRHRKLLDQIREIGAEELGEPAPELVKITRVKASTVVMAGGAALGVYLVAKQFAGVDIGSALRTASWGWVLLALLLGIVPNAAQALSITGSVAMPLPFGALVALELSDNFTGLVGGGVASDATFVRFFQRRGLAASVAVTSTLLVSVASTVAEVVLFGLAYLVARSHFKMPANSTHGSGGGAHPIVVAALVALVVGVLIIVLVPTLRRRVIKVVRPQYEAVKINMKELVIHPSKLVRLFGGAALAEVLFAMVLGAALLAYGVSLPLGELIVINTLAGLLATFAPSPGGMGVMEGGLIAGMTAAGVPTSASIPAVLISRMCTCYLPPIWGYPSLMWLRKHDYL